ncbi:SEC-C metal-binding domain-containing protein [Psychrobacillus sp. FSL H8-0510]|uniref:SEC-C metal-binding domain-containing protein n=1 Tax=Psychrobacillus sp. FSL H8-0510 TaxID=2921394 RepID=UPI004046D6C6
MGMIGRNEPCYCESGKKYKKCCMKKDSSEIEGVKFDESRVARNSHDLIGGIRELALGQLEQLNIYLNRTNKYDSHIEFISKDLLKLATTDNMEEHFIKVVRESFEVKGTSKEQIFMELRNYRRISQKKPSLSAAERKVIEMIAESNLGEYMLLNDMETADYGAMRAINKFGYEIIKEGIPDGCYVKKVDLYTDTGDKLINWDIELVDKPIQHIFVDFNPLDELYHEYEKYAHSLHGLEEESKKSLATALLRESTFTQKTSDKISYIGQAIHYTGIFEQELRILIGLNEKWDKPKKMMWADICTYLRENSLPYLSENIEDFASQLKSIHPIRNKIAHGEKITSAEFEMIKSLAIEKQAFQFISWAKIYYEEE